MQPVMQPVLSLAACDTACDESCSLRLVMQPMMSHAACGLMLSLLPVKALISYEPQGLVKSQSTRVGHFRLQHHLLTVSFDHFRD